MSKSAKSGAATAAKRRVATKPLIYVVDDEPMLLKLACVVLAPLGLRVETFQNPDEALERFSTAKHKPEVVITDYAMHKINGLELAAKCKELQPGQKVILVSGTVGPEALATASVKPDLFLPKPYGVDQLRNAVFDLLKKQSKHKCSTDTKNGKKSVK